MDTDADYAEPALYDLIIPAIDYAGRQGLGATDLAEQPDAGAQNAPAREVTLFTDWHPDNMSPGDSIELLWNNQVVQRFDLPEPAQDTIEFSVPVNVIPDEPATQVLYRVTNRSSGSTLSSAVRTVNVKRSVPGAPDPDPSDPYFNKKLLPPRGLPTLVGPDTNLTLTIEPWQNMEEGDVLTLYWGSQAHQVSNPPLSPQQVGRPQTIVVDRGLLKGVADNKDLKVTYDIRDRVGNWSLGSQSAMTNFTSSPSRPG